MTVQEVLDRIRAERDVAGRFPTRVIFVYTYLTYASLIDELKKECDIVLDLASYGREDLLPDFRTLKEELKNHEGKRILLLSMGEYLRLCLKRELNRETSVFPGLWNVMQPRDSTTKYIVPLFGGRELFDRIIPFVDERQRDFLWDVGDVSDAPEHTIKVFSPVFSDTIDADAGCLEEWLCSWDSLFAEKGRRVFSLVSSLVRYAEPIVSGISVEVLDAPFKYVVNAVKDGHKLRLEWGTVEFWADTIQYLKPDEPFAETIKNALNFGAKFSPLAAFAMFRLLTDTQKRLFWIWYKLYIEDGYYAAAIGRAPSPKTIPDSLRDTIFDLTPTPQMLSDRAKALQVLEPRYEAEYFERLDEVFPVWERFAYLTYITLDERAYAIKTVSELLRQDVEPCILAKKLKRFYPDLYYYLFPEILHDNDVEKYFDRYRKQKLLNKAPREWTINIDYDAKDSRHKILQEYGGPFTLWVDGLGVEWLPLLQKKLSLLGLIESIDSRIGYALLPTVTEYNRRWKSTDEKMDRLDELAHEGVPDDKNYFLCIARQLEVIDEIAQRVSILLKKHSQVIITGDHGSSRLAALMFHVSENYAVEPPEGSKVRSFGRFCELDNLKGSFIGDEMELVTREDKKFLVMKTYRHFKQSGNIAGGNTEETPVAGEVHGGMTPEEYLVPVICVKGTIGTMPDKPCSKKAATLIDMGI